jgi:ElaB/YqjD/DUF883 family membrane-anchored ribosome-binding protein
LNNIQNQNAKANEELGAKLMAENQKLADRLTEQLQHEISKVTVAICQLREETRSEIQSNRDDLTKLSASVDERVARHINLPQSLTIFYIIFSFHKCYFIKNKLQCHLTVF